MAELKAAVAFATKCELPCVMTHLYFIPENASDPECVGVAEAVREVALAALDPGHEFWFETGQKPPVTMRRLIEALGTGNLDLNLDPAN